jgi:NNP family nitrate/nitrite transporter-like MFS transporter
VLVKSYQYLAKHEDTSASMGFSIATLWQKPDVNPVNGKARSIPVLNPVDKHGRVFFFAWFGFMIAFLS